MKNGKGGCLCRCIHNSLNFTTQNELDKNAKDIESLLVEIEPLLVKFKKLIISTIYRPPQEETNL